MVVICMFIVSEEKMFEHCGQQRQTPEHGYTISSPCDPEGSGELIIFKYIWVSKIYLRRKY